MQYALQNWSEIEQIMLKLDLIEKDYPTGFVLEKISDEKIIVQAESGRRYAFKSKPEIDKNKLISGARVSLDMQTKTIVGILHGQASFDVNKMAADENTDDVIYCSDPESPTASKMSTTF